MSGKLSKVKNMNILEALSSQEAKKKFRELIKKYHPDIGGDDKTTKRITAAKDSGDNALIALYRELTGKKEEFITKEEDKKNRENFRKQTGEKLARQYEDWGLTLKKDFPEILTVIAFVDAQGSIIVEFHLREKTQATKKVVRISDANKYKSKNEFIEAAKKKLYDHLFPYGRKSKEKEEEPKTSKTESREEIRRKYYNWANIVKRKYWYHILLATAILDSEESESRITVRFDLRKDKKVIFMYDVERYKTKDDFMEAAKDKLVGNMF
tara:strand:- start:81 stop:884 length:804 start_codon:yes stop_codon:yes gene_type:complete